MNDRERFAATMHYRPVDRVPLYDFSFWDETLPAWHQQGLPATVNRLNAGAYFGMDISLMPGGETKHDSWISVGLNPGFESKVLEDRGDHELVLQGDGVIVLRKKSMGSIPEHHGHTLVDRASWERHYKWRLDPNHPARIPADWDARVQRWTDPHRDYPIFLACGSLYGHIRNWMGVENLSYLVYDDPVLLEEMVVTSADCIVGMLEKMLGTGAQFDAAHFWEDICYNSGPLITPDQFRQFVVPQYRRITALLRKHGCDVVWVDCDGKIDELLPLWLNAGVNCMFPVEIGTWGADPLKFRRQYGKDLLMMGGVSKLMLAGPQAGIAAEVRRLAPLVEEGGFIPMPDHRVPPDVSLANYLFYLETARQVWGKGVNLRPRRQVVE